MTILKRDTEVFCLETGPAKLFATRAGYLQATLYLKNDLLADDTFLVLLAGHISVDAASMEATDSIGTYRFLVNSRLQTSVDYSFEHFADEVTQLVTQLKERAEWRQSRERAFLLQQKLGKPGTAYVTFQPELEWGDEAIENTLRKVTTVLSNRPKRISLDRTYIIKLPEWANFEDMYHILGKYF